VNAELEETPVNQDLLVLRVAKEIEVIPEQWEARDRRDHLVFEGSLVKQGEWETKDSLEHAEKMVLQE